MPRTLEGKVALVTGGAKRIGRSISEKLASLGAAVIVNYQNSKAAAGELVGSLQAAGGRAMAWQADVSRRDQVIRMFEAVRAEFGRLDILINNAAIFFPAQFESLTEEQWDRIMNSNLKSTFLCSQAATPLLRASGGQIINMSSLGGLLSWPTYTHYCVSKAGVIMLTRCMARALAPEVRVNSIAPGTIEFPGEVPHEDFIRRAPLHRTGTGEDITNAVEYLLSADFVTGQTIVVDGGRQLV
ncbi:MAG: 3-oxoacyl-ACP reductase family protein [Candidatus Acidiferrales bacterium]